VDTSKEAPWFKMDRACIDHDVFFAHHGNAFRVYAFLLAKRRHEPGMQGGIEVGVGQVYAATRFVALGCQVTQSTASRCICFLKSKKLIQQVRGLSKGVYKVYGLPRVNTDSPTDSPTDSKVRREKREVSKDTDFVGPFFHCKDGFNMQLTKDEYNTVYAHLKADTEKHLAKLADHSRIPGRPWRCNRVNLAKNIVARWEKENAQQTKHTTGNGFQKAVDRVQPKNPYREVEGGGLLGVDG
jgi:hypothetical protein